MNSVTKLKIKFYYFISLTISLLKNNKHIYFFYIKFFSNSFNYFPKKKITNLYIYGYQRSGNDYAKKLIRSLYPSLKISSHFHRVSSLKFCLDNKINSIVLLRNPGDCISSSIAKDFGKNYNLFIKVKLIVEYIYIYKYIYNNFQKFICISFEDLIKNQIKLIQVMKYLNIKNENNYDDFTDLSIKKKLFNKKLPHNNNFQTTKGPNKEKQNLKSIIIKDLNQIELFLEAENIYKDVMKFYK